MKLAENGAREANCMHWMVTLFMLMTVSIMAQGMVSCSGGQQVQLGGGSDSGDDDDNDTWQDDDDGPQTIDEVISACGVTKAQMDDPDMVIIDKTTKSWPKVFVGQKNYPFIGTVTYRVAITTVINIRSTMGQTTTSTDFEIDATPSAAQSEAQGEVTPYRGISKTKGLTIAERMELMEEDDTWAGVFCTIQPAKEVSSTVGGNSQTVQYKPAIPTSISPKADPERYEAEIGQGKTFTGLEVEVTSSSRPEMPVGKTYSGSVTIAPVESTLVIQPGEGAQPISIPADVAYKIKADFGSKEVTRALGLFPSQTFYINHSKRDFEAIVIDSGYEKTGMVVLSDHFQ